MELSAQGTVTTRWVDVGLVAKALRVSGELFLVRAQVKDPFTATQNLPAVPHKPRISGLELQQGGFG